MSEPVAVRIHAVNDPCFIKPESYVEIEGHRIDGVTEVSVNLKPGPDGATVTVTMLPWNGMDLQFTANVHLSIIPDDLDGFALEETPLPGGGRRIRLVPVPTP